eukprot:108176_1
MHAIKMANVASIASSAAKSVGTSAAKSVGTLVLSITRKWFYERVSKSVEDIASKNNEISNIQQTSFNEIAVSRNQAISSALQKQLDQIKEGIEILRNKDFESAKAYFIEAIRWRNDTQKFKKFIEQSYNKCIEAKSTISKPTDKIYLYSLMICCGYIYHSNYGSNYLGGLKHIQNVLIDMNKDMQLRRSLGAALGSKIYWSKKEKELIQSTIYFAIRTNSFIKQIQGNVQINNQNNCNDEDEKYSTQLKHDSKLPIGYLQIDNKLNCDLTLQDFFNDQWLPKYYNGYYFGNINNSGCKYSILSTKNFCAALNALDEPIIIDDIMIYTDKIVKRKLLDNENNDKEFEKHWFVDGEFKELKNAFSIHINKYIMYCDAKNVLVKEIQEKMSPNGHLPTKLIFNSHYLEEKKYLDDYKIPCGSKLRFILVVRGS